MVAAAKSSPQNALTYSPAEWYNSSGNKSDQSNDKEAFH